MRQLFLRFYLTVVLCFLASALIIGGLYKHMIERINQHYLTDIFQTTISIVEEELGDLPQSIWHSEISRLRGKLPVPVEIEQLDAYTLSPPNRKALARCRRTACGSRAAPGGNMKPGISGKSEYMFNLCKWIRSNQ